MAKQLWYTFYFGMAIGILAGLVLALGVGSFKFSIFTDSIGSTVAFLHLSGNNALYFTIIAIMGLACAFLAIIYKIGSTLLNAGDYGMIIFLVGLFGTLFLVAGRVSILGAIGLAVLAIGVTIAFRVEKEPPGSEKSPER